MRKIRIDEIATLVTRSVNEAKRDLYLNSEVFTDQWTDPDISGRDDALKRIGNYISDCATGIRRHLIINGTQGQGKTMIVKSIVSHYNAPSTVNSLFHMCYIDCAKILPKQMFLSICDQLHYRANNIAPIDAIDKGLQKPCLIFLDHLERIDNRQYFHGAIDRIEKISLISFVFITSDPKRLYRYLMKNGNYKDLVKLTFQPYSATELKEIALHRIIKGLTTRLFVPDEVLTMMCTKVYEIINSDVRFMIKVLLDALTTMQVRKLQSITPAIMNTVFNNDHKIILTGSGIEVFDQYSGVLFTMCLSMIQNNIRSVFRSDLYGRFLVTIAAENLPPKSETWFHRHLHSMHDLGIVQMANHPKKGTHGVVSVVKIIATPEKIQSYIKSTVKENE